MSKIIDNNENKSIVQMLTQLGLSEKEALVYIALLPHERVGSSKLVRATGLHGQFVYNALDKLIALDLAEQVVIKGRRKFTPHSPNRLVILADNRRLVARNAANELAKRFQGENELNAEMFKGLDSLVANELRLLEDAPDNSEICVMGCASNDFAGLMEFDLDYYEKKRLEKNISVRLLTTKDLRGHFVALAKKRQNFDVRSISFIQNGMADTDIWPTKTVFKVYSESPIAFVVESEEMATNHRKFFDSMWEIAE